MQNKTIVVWFSCGAASAVAAKLAVEKYGENNNVMIVNNPVIEEHNDNLRFKNDVSKWIGQDIIEAKNKDFPNASIIEVFEKRKYMSGVAGAPCSMLLKKEARYQFEKKHDINYHVLGFTADEPHRHERFTKAERENVIPVLIDEGMTKGNCFDYLKSEGVKLPEIYKHGFPNANCIGCVKSSSPTYWNLVRNKFPEVFEHRAWQSRKIGAKLVKYKGKRIFLDELPKDAKGGKLKGLDCGIFCDNY
jgi:3'-phosphoadenosine 5'-phosphosulfate sulfotransferase (PAPS reductase)/FAD synthetase